MSVISFASATAITVPCNVSYYFCEPYYQPCGSVGVYRHFVICPFSMDEFEKQLCARLPYLEGISVKHRPDSDRIDIMVEEQIGKYNLQMSFQVKFANDGTAIYYGTDRSIDVRDLASVENIVERVVAKMEEHPGVQKNKRLYEMEKTIAELQETIHYMPGGPVYQEAKNHFENLI
nr:hypothetical protein K-LCC10_0203 [Kaumoebavirus]